MWLSDCTELLCCSGKASTVAIIHLCSRRILGITVSHSMQTHSYRHTLDEECGIRKHRPSFIITNHLTIIVKHVQYSTDRCISSTTINIHISESATPRLLNWKANYTPNQMVQLTDNGIGGTSKCMRTSSRSRYLLWFAPD
jgi:hypothetical protein